MIRRDTKDSKVTSETAGGKCEPDPLLKSTKEKENIVTQRRKKNKQSQYLDNEKSDQSHYTDDNK